MEIYLLRHTPVNLPRGICYGASDLELSKDYTKHLKEVRQKANRFSFTFSSNSPNRVPVYSSPLIRSLRLAKDLSGLEDSEIYIDHRLREMSFGEWENQPWEKISRLESDAWSLDFESIAPPKGETFLQLQERSISFLQEMTSKYQENPSVQKLLIVTHGGVIRSILSYAVDVKPSHAFRFWVQNGSFTILKHENSSYQILGVNI